MTLWEKWKGQQQPTGLKMSLFERVSRVARAEINYAKSQSVSPDSRVDCPVALLQDAVLKTRLAITKTSPDEARSLKLTLRDLEARLSSAKAQLEEPCRAWMEVRLQELDRLTDNDLSNLVKLFEEINGDIAAMKEQLPELLEPSELSSEDEWLWG
jgi:hypothetical protein